MNLQESKDIISSFLKRDELMFNLEQKQNISRAFAVTIEDIYSLMDKDKELVMDPERFSSVLLSMSLLSDVTLRAPISDNYSIFVAAYSELMYNWNQNTYKDPIMNSMAMMLSRIIESRDLFVRTTSIIKESSATLLEVANWSPPSYEVAKTYLENLLEQNEKGKE